MPSLPPQACISISPTQRATHLWLATNTMFGPPPKLSHNHYMPQFSRQEHLAWTSSLDICYTPKQLDPTLELAVQHAHLFHPITDFRRQAVRGIHNLVTEMKKATETWLHTLLHHVQHARTTATSSTTRSTSDKSWNRPEWTTTTTSCSRRSSRRSKWDERTDHSHNHHVGTTPPQVPRVEIVTFATPITSHRTCIQHTTRAQTAKRRFAVARIGAAVDTTPRA